MTVREVIQQLTKFNPDMLALVSDCDYEALQIHGIGEQTADNYVAEHANVKRGTRYVLIASHTVRGNGGEGK